MSARWIDWAFRSRKTGKITLAQRPNLPLYLFVATRTTELALSTSGPFSDVLHWTGIVTLVWWAGAELLTGVNPFRRALGAAALITVVL